jgi:hypothetical protein
VLLLAVVLSNDSSAAKQNANLDKYREAATRCHGGDYSPVRQELENAPIDRARQELDAVGVLLCEQPEFAAGLLDSIKNEMLQAELLLRLAIGSRDSRGRRTCRLDDSFASRAAKLLESKDPFVRGIADWALAIRVGTDNDRRRFWPRPDDSAWFEALAMGRPQHRLENDYVRQAVVSEIHYSPKTLSESATQMIDRAERFVAAFNASFSVSDRDTIAAELQVMARLLGRLQTLADVESVSVEATAAARRHWLDMRHAARRIVDCHLAKACQNWRMSRAIRASGRTTWRVTATTRRTFGRGATSSFNPVLRRLHRPARCSGDVLATDTSAALICTGTPIGLFSPSRHSPVGTTDR